jgi:hypothetical protein
LPFTAAADGVFITLSDIRAFRAHYLDPDGDPLDWRASPLCAPDHAGLPRTDGDRTTQ